jgi:hypothetical protein
VLEEWGLKRYHPGSKSAPANGAAASGSSPVRAN